MNLKAHAHDHGVCCEESKLQLMRAVLALACGDSVGLSTVPLDFQRNESLTPPASDNYS